MSGVDGRADLARTLCSFARAWPGQGLVGHCLDMGGVDANLWQLRHDLWQPVQVRHPWATQRLPDGLLPIPGHTGNDNGEIIALNGEPFADLLELPKVWPPQNP
jgi:hypothetical protein